MKKILFTAAAVAAASVAAQAQSTGNPPTFPANPPNLYGNIDASQSTYTQTTVGNDTLTIALDATPHFKAPLAVNPPPVTLLGPGLYGVSTGLGGDGRSFWNYDFGVTSSASDLASYMFTLTILNEGNGQSTSFDPSAITDNNGTAGSSFGNSESLDFTLPPGSLFFGSIGYDPNANDTYDFTLTARGVTGGPVASDTIKVIAGTGAAGVPDASSTMALMSLGLGGLGLMSRRFRK